MNSRLRFVANVEQTNTYFKDTGFQQTSVFQLQNLCSSLRIAGPAIIIDQTQTLVISPNAEARILQSHVVVDIAEASVVTKDPGVVDHIQLSVFGHRFMSIAEQMGRALQKTAVSLNIKERLDFSCALFGPDGMRCLRKPFICLYQLTHAF